MGQIMRDHLGYKRFLHVKQADDLKAHHHHHHHHHHHYQTVWIII
jgi:hypothetical protein